MRESLQDMLIRHEGLKLMTYRCSAGKLTIGVGRNIEDRALTKGESLQIFGRETTRAEQTELFKEYGITEEQALYLLRNDISSCMADLRRYCPFFDDLTETRQDVLIDMCFMGLGRLLEFKKMIAALKVGDYDTAAAEMLDSKWATQVGSRATELAALMQRG